MIREAKSTLSAAGIHVGQAFDTLTVDQLAAITAEAADVYRLKHGGPMPADSASYVRKRYDLLQRRADQ